MNTFTKAFNMRMRAAHPLHGEVTILSKWQNSDGKALYRVKLNSDPQTIRYVDLSKGGAL
jgi:hypothetical protein